MDAKPQRPLRSFKVRDENLPPNAVYGKSVHQRNKSSPALSTLAQQQGTLKAGARRAVFADLSNTNKGNQSSKDDSALVTTKSALQSLKEVVPEGDKAAPLLRPAQRPISVSGLKGLLNNLTSTSSAAVSKIPAESLLHSTDLATDARDLKSKRSTAVFRDLSVQSTENMKRSDKDGALPPLPTDAVDEKRNETVPTSQALMRQHPSPQQLPPLPTSYQQQEHQQPPKRPTSSSYDHALPPLPSSSNYYDIRSDGVALNGGNGLPSSYSGDASHSRQAGVPYFQSSRAPLKRVEEAQAIEDYCPNHESPPEAWGDGYAYEYWEGDYDECYGEPLSERYNDDGYTTARSIKSRGDYTTGPTTVVLAPKMTAQVEIELAAAKKYVQESRTADEIEEDESWDTSMVAEYGDEIFDYMRSLEERMRPNPYYMDNQTEVQWSMRSVLMDWLVQVHHRFSLLPETLFLCVNYIDRFLSCKVVSLGKLQLVGATAIFVAAKYEEINCPSVSEIQYMVDGGYTVDEILKAERFMLSMLQFELGWPGPMSFLRRISKADDYDLETRTLAKYFLEITIMDERFVACIPSFTAAGAHCLARLMLGKGSWTQAHVYYSNYTYSQLRPLLSAILSCCEEPTKHHSAVFDKYGDKRFKRASFFVQNEMGKGFVLPPAGRTSIGGPSGAGALIAQRDWRFGSAAPVEPVGGPSGRFL